VAPSKRAVTIPIDEIRGVARLLVPGDRIDMVAAMDVGKGVNQHREVKTIMQDVVILATGLRIVNDLPMLYEKQGKDYYINYLKEDKTYTTITVEASPEEAQDLIYILSTSPQALFLTLRHPSDHSKKQRPETTMDTLLGKVSNEMMNLRQPAVAPLPPPVPPKQKPKKRGPFESL
jgi:pilus assembly protein CpaB